MLYIGAVEGADVWLRPDQVTRMTDAQALKTDDDARLSWAKESVAPGKGEIAGRWYAVNTREPVRDETLRAGLVANGSVIERQGLPTTSPAGRYALKADFAKLFDPALNGTALKTAIQTWQATHLNAGALAWDSFVWFAAEPQHLILLSGGEEKRARRLSDWATL